MSTEPNLVDWLTLAAAALGTLLGTFTAVWQILRGEREKPDLHLDWEWFGDGGPIAELPFLYVHNRSSVTINIVGVNWYGGAFRRKEKQYTAIYHEDPGDVNFPYPIDPGSFKKFFLDDSAAVRHFDQHKEHANFFGFFRRSSLWVCVKTMRGKRKFIGAERALPWRSRPKWLLGKTDES